MDRVTCPATSCVFPSPETFLAYTSLYAMTCLFHNFECFRGAKLSVFETSCCRRLLLTEHETKGARLDKRERGPIADGRVVKEVTTYP